MDAVNKLSAECLVACDQSYNASLQPGNFLDQYPDGGVDRMPAIYYDPVGIGLSDWKVEQRVDDPQTGLGYAIYKRINGTKKDYMVAMQGTRGPSAQDWIGNLNFGIDKWQSQKWAGLQDYLKGIAKDATTGDILITGQSLGGALAEYAAYDFVSAPESSGFDKSRLALVTFNGLGGVAGLQMERDGFNPNRFLGSLTRHYWIQGDIVNRLGAGTGPYANLTHLNGSGNEYRLDYFAGGILPDGSPKWLDPVAAHRIESGFYAGINTYGTQWSAHPAGIKPLEVTKLAQYAMAFGNLYNSVDSAKDGEATARIIATLVYATAYGEEKELSNLISAVADIYFHGGKLTQKQYDFVKSTLPRMLSDLARSPSGAKLQVRSLMFAAALDMLENDPTKVVDAATVAEIKKANTLFQDSTRYYDNPTLQLVRGYAMSKFDAWSGQPDDKLRATLTLAREIVANTLGDPDAYPIVRRAVQAHMSEAIDLLLDPGEHRLKNFAYKLAGWTLLVGAELVVSLGETVSYCASVIQAVGRIPGLMEETFLDFALGLSKGLKGLATSIANALPDFTADYSDAPVTFAEITAFADQAAVVSSFTTSLKSLSEEILGLLTGSGNATAAEAIRQTLDEAAATVLNAAQKVILGNGIGPNPFESGTADPDAVVSLDALKEGSALTLGAYLPYASGKDGQSIRFKLAGVGDSAMRIQDGSGVHTVTDGEFTLTVAPGRKEEVFTLWALGAISADAQLSLSATLSAVNGTATHQTHIEATGTLVNRPDAAPATLTLTGDLAPILDAQGRITKDALGNVVVNPRASMPNRADELYCSGGGDVIRGGGGDDTIRGKEGADRIEAGSGADIAEGDAGNDTLEGGGGQDLLTGAEGDDTIYGEDSVSLTDAVDQGSIAAGSGERGDWEDGGGGDDVLVGSVGNDALMGGADNDILLGGGGDDDLYGDWQSWVDRAWQIQRQIISENGVKRYTSTLINAGGQEMAGGNDLLYGGGGNDVLYVEAGNDGNWRRAA